MSIDDGTDVDFTDTETVPFQHDGRAKYPVLAERQRRSLRATCDGASEDAIEEFLRTARLWKLSADDLDSLDLGPDELRVAKYLHEATFADLLDARSACRYEDEVDATPCEDRTRVAEVYRAASKRFVAEHLDEDGDGTLLLYRGFGYELPYLVRDMLDSPLDDEYDLEVSVVSNHTIHRKTAETFGLALFRRDVDIDWVVFTPEFLLGPVDLNGEERSHGEIQLLGDEIRTVDRTDVLVPDLDQRLDTFVEKLRTAPEALAAGEHDVVRSIVEDMATRKEEDETFGMSGTVERVLGAWIDAFDEHSPGGVDEELLNETMDHVEKLTEEIEPE